MNLYLSVIDGFGVYGNYLHFGMVIFFVGSAFLIFCYLWKKGKLDMDEEPKMQMLKSDEQEEKKDER